MGNEVEMLAHPWHGTQVVCIRLKQTETSERDYFIYYENTTCSYLQPKGHNFHIGKINTQVTLGLRQESGAH